MTRKNHSPLEIIFPYLAPNFLALLFCVLFFAFWAILLVYKYIHFGYTDWDLGLAAHSLWNLAHGSPINSMMGINFLANHSNYIAFMIAPLYRIFPHPLTLIALKIFAFSTGAFFLYLLAKKQINKMAGLIFMALYMIFPANIFALLFEFDFENLAIVLILAMFYFFYENRIKWFLTMAVLLCLVKENMPLVVIMFGVFAFFSKKEKKFLWGAWPILLGASTFILFMLVITPSLRENLPKSNAYLWQYHALGNTPSELVKTFITEPKKYFYFLIDKENIEFLLNLFGGFTVLGILGPQILIGLPLFMQNLLSSFLSQHTIYYHYSASIVPFVFVTAIFSCVRIYQNPGRIACWAVMGIVMVSSISHTFMYKDFWQNDVKSWNDSLDPFREQLLQKIPKDASVISTFEFLPSLSARQSLFSFHYLVEGRNHITGQAPYVVPPSVQYALIDFDDDWIATDIEKPKEYLRIYNFLSDGKWRVSEMANNIVLFEKASSPAPPLVAKQDVPFPAMRSNLKLLGNDSIELANFKKGEFDKKRRVIPFDFYWHCLKKTEEIYGMLFYLEGPGKEIPLTTRGIGYAIYPTCVWQAGEWIKEGFSLYLPELAKGEYFLKAVVITSPKRRLRDFSRRHFTRTDKDHVLLDKVPVE